MFIFITHMPKKKIDGLLLLNKLGKIFIQKTKIIKKKRRSLKMNTFKTN